MPRRAKYMWRFKNLDKYNSRVIVRSDRGKSKGKLRLSMGTSGFWFWAPIRRSK